MEEVEEHVLISGKAACSCSIMYIGYAAQCKMMKREWIDIILDFWKSYIIQGIVITQGSSSSSSSM